MKRSPKSIMYITYSLDHGGAEKMILDLARGLDPDSWRPMVCSFRPGGTLRGEFESSGIPVFDVNQEPGKDLTLPMRLYRFFRNIKPDIIHAHNGYMWLYSTLAARLEGARVVYTEHSVWESPSRLFLAASKVVEQFTSAIVAPSNYVRNLLATRQHVNPERIQVIYNGVDLDRISRRIDSGAKKKELGINPEDRIIGIVARLTPVKNHAALLAAMEIICSHVKDCRLLIVGDGETRPLLEKLAQEKGIGESVRFLGTRSDVFELLQVMDIFVLGSLSEGFPISLLEAMAAGVPIVASAVGGIPEALAHGRAGMLIQDHEPSSIARGILDLLSSPGQADMMRRVAFDYVWEHFTEKQMVLKYADIYRRLTVDHSET